MITDNDVLQIGRLLKPHGIQGEIVLLFDKETYADIDSSFYFFDIDGIFVPFFVEEMRFHTDISAYVKFEGIDDQSVAARYCNTPVFLPRHVVQSAAMDIAPNFDFFVGYTVHDEKMGEIGKITFVDHSTMNVLFVVAGSETEHLIPATEDFITEIDDNQKIIRMEFPEGLISL
ncbi:MAG TPA: ribosome maturation factor RimM [Dysgonamonadaceae bacterium]|nr:ribosome maturation factor RimM [Dysgonamonadaceae bacterium]